MENKTIDEINRDTLKKWEEWKREYGIDNKNWSIAGRWWGSGLDKKPMEIDIIAQSLDKKYILIGEAKWKARVNIKKIFESLTQKANQLPLIKGRKITYAVWTKTNQKTFDPVHHITPDMVLDAYR